MNEKRVIGTVKGIFGKENVKRNTPGKFSPRGYPDLFVIHCGELWPVEIKVNKTRLTEEQKDFLSRCRRALLIHVDTKRNHVNFYHDRDQIIPHVFLSLAEKLGEYQSFILGLPYLFTKHAE